MTLVESLYDFLSTELGLLIVGSVVIPTAFGIYAGVKSWIQEIHKKQLLTRIIIYRLELIDDACSHFRFNDAIDIINGNSEEKHCYTPMMKENEDNMNILGLIMNALNDTEIKKKAILESISNLIGLKNLLNEMITKSTPTNNVNTKEKKPNTNEEKPNNNEEKFSRYYTEDIKKLVTILNELILIKENMKQSLFKQYYVRQVIDNNRSRRLQSMVKKISSDEKLKKKTKFGDLFVPKISLTFSDIKSGYHFDPKSKYYFDNENGFIISFPPENWFGNNQILFRYLKERNDQNKVCFVLVRRNIPDFYIENFNVAITETKMEDNEFDNDTCLDKYFKELKSKYKEKGLDWGQIDDKCNKCYKIDLTKNMIENLIENLIEKISKLIKKPEKILENIPERCESVAFEISPLKYEDKNYYLVKRLIKKVRKIYILTATIEEQNLPYVQNDLEYIFNSFVLTD